PHFAQDLNYIIPYLHKIPYLNNYLISIPLFPIAVNPQKAAPRFLWQPPCYTLFQDVKFKIGR
ncbi:hypothetical protein QUW58_28350, partial [Enterocloster aldenensis]|uniref:hypothetical protein n=1 Tax=Enterocloster aldenensis TaxID=358742 RepID=UPI0025A346CA|nr:hypothetical protein [Enterocloster aldenensis]